MARVLATVPGKVMLMGEHAAALGCPAIAAAIGLYCRVHAQSGDQDGVRIDAPDLGVRMHYGWPDIDDYTAMARARWGAYQSRPSQAAFQRMRGEAPDHLVRVAVGETLRHRPRPRGLALRIDSSIPVGAGFGSSAAVAAATAAALLSLHGRAPALHCIEAAAMEIERRQHGQPSGVDHGTVLRGGVVRATRESERLVWTSVPFLSERLRYLRVYHTGTAVEATGEVVTAVRERLNSDSAGEQVLGAMAQATTAFGAWLAGEGDAADGGINALREYERCLEHLGVVPAPVCASIRAIEEAGGAAKISGAGALLVIWPDKPVFSVRASTGWQRLMATLGTPGLRVEPEMESVSWAKSPLSQPPLSP